MRLEKSKICTYNNNFKMVFTQVAMLKKEKLDWLWGRRRPMMKWHHYLCVFDSCRWTPFSHVQHVCELKHIFS
jgi:hypothetical protein